ncbi:hypothetical protein [Coprobacter tertius]|uniref:Uncharacterized protein n=1 Tax=Coprobacter tertius TaxID=2944915 RepID=A0ABT1MGX1_9BACT|nr:hypothetical protein [Coprobacter tertius]MCP9610491.1 hypothetical protein [Coprobacter tertius]
MNKTVLSILSLTAFGLLLAVISLFCGGLGFGRLFRLYGFMENAFIGTLIVLNLLIIHKVFKLYFIFPKAIMLLFGLECCSILLWFAFIYFDKNLLDWQITNYLLKITGLYGFEGDERGLNMIAVLSGIIYPFIGIGCLFTGMRLIKKIVTTKENI